MGGPHRRHHPTTTTSQQAADVHMAPPAPCGVKALFVGINYTGQAWEGTNSANDVRTMREVLKRRAGQALEERVLCDDTAVPGARAPTKEAILDAFRWLAGSSPGESLFFFYSGMSTRVRDADGDEDDGFDEAICPVDHKQAGFITDDVIFKELVASLPSGVRLTAVMDCGNSGSAMDLPYEFQATDSALKVALLHPDRPDAMRVAKAANKCDAEVVLFSGCSDTDCIAVVQDPHRKFGLPAGTWPGGEGGVFTNVLASVLLNHPPGSLRYIDMLHKVREEITAKGFWQVPQLSASVPLNLAAPFEFVGRALAPCPAPAECATGPGQGRTKALYIGISYHGQQHVRERCVNDAKTMRNVVRHLVAGAEGYEELVLLDGPCDIPGVQHPSKQAMLQAFRWLALDSRAGDTLFFFYSGGAGRVADADGDEESGFDGTLYPADHTQAGSITDDTIFDKLVAPLPPGVRLTAVMDCSYSGSAMDLPYELACSDAAMQALLAAPSKRAMRRCKSEPVRYSGADVVLLSACSDAQQIGSVQNLLRRFDLPATLCLPGPGGVFTGAVVSMLLGHPLGTLPFGEAVALVQSSLKEKGFKQVPQVSASLQLSFALPFNLYGALGVRERAPRTRQGKVKALFVGINYMESEKPLRGCVNDMRTMQSLVRDQGLADSNYEELVLVDDDTMFKGAHRPTKEEILRAFRWLVVDTLPGDTLLFFYSGHGGQSADEDGDEDDGFDEAICPVDHKQAGLITDDTIFARLVAPLPAGVRMTAVIDSCHSGTVMDLPFELKAVAAASVSNARCLQPAAGKLVRKKQECNADVVLISGCTDAQLSADVSDVKRFDLPNKAAGAGGACSTSLASVLMHASAGSLRYGEVLDNMRAEIKNRKLDQHPQLSASKPMNLDLPFSFFGPLCGAS